MLRDSLHTSRGEGFYSACSRIIPGTPDGVGGAPGVEASAAALSAIGSLALASEMSVGGVLQYGMRSDGAARFLQRALSGDSGRRLSQALLAPTRGTDGVQLGERRAKIMASVTPPLE